MLETEKWPVFLLEPEKWRDVSLEPALPALPLRMEAASEVEMTGRG